MDDYLKNNRELWDNWAPQHARSKFYDIEGFKKGKCTLDSIQTEEIGNVRGKSLLHLQCHFGLDTLSLARLGAKVTGVDFSSNAIDIARSLRKDLGIEAEFICSDIYSLPEKLNGKFDVVYTTAGVLCWLPDLKRWGGIITHFLKPGGFFYIFENHPVLNAMNDPENVSELKITHSYFHTAEPERGEITVSYAGAQSDAPYTSYEWTHSMGDIVNALVSSGLTIEFLHEFPALFFKRWPFMKQDNAGWWRLEGDKLPLTFSLKATKSR
jgi:SAM-dependent methyltransferase